MCALPPCAPFPLPPSPFPSLLSSILFELPFRDPPLAYFEAMDVTRPQGLQDGGEESEPILLPGSITGNAMLLEMDPRGACAGWSQEAGGRGLQLQWAARASRLPLLLASTRQGSPAAAPRAACPDAACAAAAAASRAPAAACFPPSPAGPLHTVAVVEEDGQRAPATIGDVLGLFQQVLDDTARSLETGGLEFRGEAPARNAR